MDHMLTRLMLITVNSGMVTAFAAMLAIITVRRPAKLEFLNDSEYSDAWPAIQEGINKLKTYQGYTDYSEVPAYTLATRKLKSYLI